MSPNESPNSKGLHLIHSKARRTHWDSLGLIRTHWRFIGESVDSLTKKYPLAKWGYLISFLSPTGDNRWLCKPFLSRKGPFRSFCLRNSPRSQKKPFFRRLWGCRRRLSLPSGSLRYFWVEPMSISLWYRNGPEGLSLEWHLGYLEVNWPPFRPISLINFSVSQKVPFSASVVLLKEL